MKKKVPKILVVGSERAFSDLYGVLEATRAYQLEYAAYWGTANVFLEPPPALVLLDISLANFTFGGQAVDGLVLSRLIKDDPATAHIPVLLATAHAMEGDRERFLAASKADDYLQKPIFDPAVLVEKVKGLLDTSGKRDLRG